MWNEISYNKFKNRGKDVISEPFSISEFYLYESMECDECNIGVDMDKILKDMIIA